MRQLSLSVFDYDDILYMNASAVTLKPLDAVYQPVLRFITGDNYNTHHCELYARVGWPSLSVGCDRQTVIYLNGFTIFCTTPFLDFAAVL